MSRPRYWWWKIAKAYVQVYPQLARRVQEQEHTTMTASYRGMPGCFTAGRPGGGRRSPCACRWRVCGVSICALCDCGNG